MSEALAWPLGLGVLGLVFGSFIATVAVRWPAGRSALRGRSSCDGCDRALRVHELVPVVSYVAARGRCATCGGRIDPLHPWCELIGAFIGVTAGIVGAGPVGAAGALFGWLLLTLGAVDLRAFWLPNILTAILAISGLVLGPAPLADRVIGGAAGFAALAVVAAGYARLRGRVGLGGGDPKLFGAIGLWLGWRALPLVLLIACVAGLGWALAARLQRNDRLPFGTLLAVGGFAVWVLERMR